MKATRMDTTMRHTTTLLALTTLALGVSAALSAEVPVRPEQLTFPPLAFKVPDAASMRVKLANGVPAYLVEDKTLPLVSVRVMFRGGQYLEPSGKEGVAELTGEVWRSGGAGTLDARALDEELDFLAAQLVTDVGAASGSVQLNLLAKDLDRGLALLMAVLREPRFDEARLAKAKEALLADMKRRNDDSSTIEEREWDRLVYGDDYWLNHLPTKASVDGIVRANLAAFHRLLANPANFVVAAAGDFDRRTMIAKLNATLGTWKITGAGVPPVPQPRGSAKPGVYLIDKPDVNQGRVSIGHLGARRPIPDEFSLRVADDTLGGAGFTAWMLSRVRSDEGLAYAAYSDFGIDDLYPGAFRASFQSKSSTCARAAKLTLELIAKIRAGKVTEKELATSKNSFIETFPRAFESRFRTVTLFAQDELVGRPHEYWATYRERVGAVTAKAVGEAATAHIKPDSFIILVVGNVNEILEGHPDYPDVKFDRFGSLVKVPLRDPLTLKSL